MLRENGSRDAFPEKSPTDRLPIDDLQLGASTSTSVEEQLTEHDFRGVNVYDVAMVLIASCPRK